MTQDSSLPGSAHKVPETSFAALASQDAAATSLRPARHEPGPMQSARRPFVDMDEGTLHALAPGGCVRSYPRNVIVLSEGDTTDSLYVVVAGRVKAFVSDAEGKEVVVNTIGAGDYFGELVLDGGPRSASVMTLEPCRFYVIPHADVERLLNDYPPFARDLTCKLISKVRSLTARVFDLASKDVYARLAKFLHANAVEAGGRHVVPERLTHQEIAARIGGSREMVSRILKDLASGGYISIDDKHISLLRKLPSDW